MWKTQGSGNMRLTMLLAVLATILVLGVGLIACDADDGVKGSGNLVTRDFELTDFTSLRISGAPSRCWKIGAPSYVAASEEPCPRSP